ncbi:glycosyltransferase [Natrinema sp. SYSU A 869]|uniref:glycosyltransferase n=1 Tax=Natrinema sp. SYSU A 869 TaxID=2871694 RepID=UPI001CA39B5B|nr:glycosyltransferase [Natrinema sp. SYSU A 869]
MLSENQSIDGSNPDVSIIIPVYNDPEGIRATLSSLIGQTVSSERFEILPVDNGSTDHTRTVVEEIEQRNEQVRSATEDEISGSYAARNEGIKESTGDVCVFIDADMTVPDGWLESALRTFQSTNTDYMGCSVELILPDDPTVAARYDRHTGFPVEQYLEHQQFTPTCCLVTRRDVFETVGLFDHRLVSGGDKEFGNRVHEAGYDMHYAENVTIYHPTRNSIPELINKDRRVGRGLCQLQRYHPDRYGAPGIPPRPSGVKSPNPDLGTSDRLAFGALSKILTGVRAQGYYQEYLTGEQRNDLGDIPRLDQ